MIMANAYDAFASAYDALNSDADYTAMADHIDKVFARSNIPRSSLVLDLGCGTGMLTRELDARGYDMTGVDSSEEMLGKAYENSAQSGKILYLCQDITEFELYGTVAAAVCTTDTLNHLMDDESVAKVFSLLHNYLDPGGIFIFDVNSEYKFSSVYGQNDYVLEDEGCLLTWQNDYDPENATADFYLTLFEETDGGLWRRTDTEFSEKYHSPEKLTAMLTHCGFEVLSVTDSYTDGSISEKTQRLCFTAKSPFPDKISGNLFTTEIKSEDIGYLRGEDGDGNTTGKSHDNRIGDKLDYSTQLEYP